MNEISTLYQTSLARVGVEEDKGSILEQVGHSR